MIIKDPGIRNGKPIIKGTRISVIDIWLEYDKLRKTAEGILFVPQTKYKVGVLINKIKNIVEVLQSSDMKNHIEFL